MVKGRTGTTSSPKHRKSPQRAATNRTLSPKTDNKSPQKAETKPKSASKKDSVGHKWHFLESNKGKRSSNSPILLPAGASQSEISASRLTQLSIKSKK